MILFSLHHLSHTKIHPHNCYTVTSIVQRYKKRICQDHHCFKDPTLFVEPYLCLLCACNLSLQLKQSVQQCLSCRWTTWDIDIHRDNSIAPANNSITIVIISTTVGTTTHRHNPSRLRHLVIYLSESRRHLIGKGSSDDHAI